MASGKNTVSLSDLVIALRAEIDAMQANLAKEGKTALLKIEKADVELSFGVQKSSGGKGGVSFKVFGIGFEGSGEAGVNNMVQQKLTLSLVPIDDTPVGVAVAEE